MTRLTIHQVNLSRPDLVFEGSCPPGYGYWLGEGTTRPAFEPRYDYAPDSAWVGGKQLLGVVKEQGTLETTLFARAPSAAVLEQVKVYIEEALFQFVYTVTFNDGADRSYFADPCIPNWGEIVPGHDKLHIARGTVSIPVNP